MGFTMASCSANITIKGVVMPSVSAGSNHVGASEMCTPQVSCPSGWAAAKPVEGKTPVPASTADNFRISRRLRPSTESVTMWSPFRACLCGLHRRKPPYLHETRLSDHRALWRLLHCDCEFRSGSRADEPPPLLAITARDSCTPSNRLSSEIHNDLRLVPIPAVSSCNKILA